MELPYSTLINYAWMNTVARGNIRWAELLLRIISEVSHSDVDQPIIGAPRDAILKTRTQWPVALIFICSPRDFLMSPKPSNKNQPVFEFSNKHFIPTQINIKRDLFIKCPVRYRLNNQPICSNHQTPVILLMNKYWPTQHSTQWEGVIKTEFVTNWMGTM